jgi:hypothetical protein
MVEAAEHKFRIREYFDHFTLEYWRVVHVTYERGPFGQYNIPKEVWDWYQLPDKFSTIELAKRYATFLKTKSRIIEEFTL